MKMEEEKEYLVDSVSNEFLIIALTGISSMKDGRERGHEGEKRKKGGGMTEERKDEEWNFKEGREGGRRKEA